MTVEYSLLLAGGNEKITFEWDPNKDSSNRKKHGINFEEAATIFQNDVLTKENNRSYGEIREITLGQLRRSSISDSAIIVCVVHTERSGNIRIISARKANSYERKQFNENIRQNVQAAQI